jgi:hypothetical protein
MTPWVTALVLVVILAAFYIFLPNRRALRDDYVQRQTDEHEAMVAMLREWLDNERIFQAILRPDEAKPDFTAMMLESIYRNVGKSSEGYVREQMAKILRYKTTRRVIAHYMERQHGVEPFECRRALLEWATYREVA